MMTNVLATLLLYSKHNEMYICSGFSRSFVSKMLSSAKKNWIEIKYEKPCQF